MKAFSCKRFFLGLFFALTFFQGGLRGEPDSPASFEYFSEAFADLQILRYEVPGFEDMPLQQKELLYYLHEAGLAGRDINWDQHCGENLAVRRTLENIVRSYSGSREGKSWDKFMEYTKRVWFSNGIHHHYSTVKLLPEFSEEYFEELVSQSDADGFDFGTGESPNELCFRLIPVIFDPVVLGKRVNKAPDVDNVSASANHFYVDVTAAEVDAYYESKRQSDHDPSWGLNSQLVKEDGQLRERVWKVGGMYTEAIEQIVFWLEKAVGVAENEAQKGSLERLISYYRSGDLADFDEYSIAWIQDTDSVVDVVNGFIEVYGDAKGLRGSYESMVSVKDPIASRRIEAISGEAQWFEDNSPILDEHKKAEVTGISARVINVVAEAGDASPATPIGVNLPNADWIRSEYGSKSVNLGNIVHAYKESRKKSGVLEEFYYGEELRERLRTDAGYSDDLHTDMHEVIGHASGRINTGVGTFSETLGPYASTLEEARADLVALYYLMDPKLIEIGVMDSLETGMAAYDSYLMNGLMLQLRRLNLGDDIEEDHMRNRQMIAKWAVDLDPEQKAVRVFQEEDKTYVLVQDYAALREIFGQELREVQRIKSEGDFAAGKALVERYGVKVDPELHQEVLDRFAALDLPAYSGFINPELQAVCEEGRLVDVKIVYPEDFSEQMLHYSEKYSFLPTYN